MVAIQCLCVACNRPPSAAGQQALAPPAASQTAPGASVAAQTVAPSGSAQPEAKPAVTMKPVAKPTPAAKAIVAPTLAGIDRHLVYRPFDTVAAGDQALGPLFDRSADPTLAATLDATAAALADGTLPYERLDPGAAIVARAMYQRRLESDHPIAAVRFAEKQTVPGGGIAVRFRVIGKAPGHYAQGLLLAHRADDGAWMLEHLELDLASLDVDRVRKDPWDPYGASHQ